MAENETRVELTDDEQKVLEVLRAEPNTLRAMNPEAITEEAVFGPDHGVLQDEDLPEQEVYDRYTAACESLFRKDVLRSVEFMGGMTAYCLEPAYA